MGLFWFAAALLGAALIFAGCETEADTETVTVREGVAADVDALQELLGTDGVNYVEYLGSLTIDSGDALAIPAGKTVKVGGGVTVNGILAVGGALTLPATGTITNNGIVIGSNAFLTEYSVLGTTVPTDAGLPDVAPASRSVTAVENLTLNKGTPPAWYGYDLTVYVYGTLTVEGDATAPASNADVVAIGNVLIDGSEATVATLNAAKIDVSNATITLNENKTVTVTLPSPLSGPTFKVTGEQGVLKVSGPIVINNARVTNNNGYVEFVSAVTKADISGGGRVRFSGAAAFADTVSNITAGLVEFTNAATPTFAVANSSIKAEKITFTKGLTLSAALALDGNIVLPSAAAEIVLGTSVLTLKTGSTITVNNAIVLTATTDSTLTGGLAGAKITPVLAADPAPAKLQFDGSSASTITLGGTLEAGSLKLGTYGSAIVAAGATLSLGSGSTLDAGALILGAGSWEATNATATIAAGKITLGSVADAAFGKDDGTAATVLTGGAAITNTFTASGASATVTLSQATNALTITGSAADATLTTGDTAGIKVKAALNITTATVDISAAATSIIALLDGGDGITLANANSIIVLDATKALAVTSTHKDIDDLTVGADVAVTAESDDGDVEVGSFTGAASANTIVENGSATFEIKKGIKTAS